MLRGSGIAYDIRKEEPYELYAELDFDIPVTKRNDSYGRYRLYMEEMKESVKILRQLISMYPKTDTQLMAHAPEYISAPKEEIMTQPSFFHTGLLQDLLVGTYIADVVTIIGSTNIVFGEVDR